MTRRLIMALVGTAAAALVVAGVGTLLLARAGARDDNRRQLEEQAAGLADFGRQTRAPVNRFNQLRRGLELDGLEFLVARPNGSFTGDLPDGVRREDLDLDRLRDGAVMSGERDGRVWAAAGISLPQRTPLVVLTRRVDPFLGSAARWFAIAAGLTLVLAALAAVRIARRLTRRLREAEAVTRRVAAGDLSVRVAVPRRRDEVAELGASVNSMAAALERAQGAERSFLLSVSHDLRTPLTAIRGWAEALADGTAADPVHTGQVLELQAGRLERLVTDLLELARLRAGRFSLHPEPVAVEDVVGEAVRAAQPVATHAGVRLTLSTASITGESSTPAMVLADPARVAQVLADLLDNALRHATTLVAVAVDADGAVARVIVDDDGPGIAAEDRASVFERFWTSVGRNDGGGGGGGEGLGLAIVAELCQAMDGRVGLHESPQGGARFVVELPRTPASADPALATADEGAGGGTGP